MDLRNDVVGLRERWQAEKTAFAPETPPARTVSIRRTRILLVLHGVLCYSSPRRCICSGENDGYSDGHAETAYHPLSLRV